MLNFCEACAAICCKCDLWKTIKQDTKNILFSEKKEPIAFDMRVIGFDPFLSEERATELGIELVENVPDMLPRIDYLTVHTPLTPETKGLIDAENS